MPYRKLFLSRWAALLWAGGIVWTAVDTVGVGPPAHFAAGNVSDNAAAGANDSDTDATGMAVNSADLAALANAMHGD